MKDGVLCIQFYNLKVGSETFSGCGRVLARRLKVTFKKVDVGCFSVNCLNDTQQVNALEMPYLDVPQGELPEGPDPIYVGEAVPMEKIKRAGHKMK